MAGYSSVKNASEEVFDFVCGPCNVDKKVLQAKGYCSDCQDYLCDLCFETHIRPKPLRHHVLLDEKAMPKDKNATTATKTSDICTERCEKHPGNIIEYYCQSHDFLGCTKCFISDNHRKCEYVVCIEDTAHDIFHSQEFTNFEGTVEQLANVLSESSSIQLQNDENIKIYSIRAKSDIKNFRARINEYHNRQKNQMDNQVSQMKDRQTSQLVSTSKQIEHLEKDMKTIQETIERTRNLGQKSNLYIYMKRNSNQLKLLEDRIETVKKDSVVSEYTFTPDGNILGQKAEMFGTLEIKENAKHVEGFPVNNMEAASPQGYQDIYPVKVPANQPQTLQSPHQYPQFVASMDPWQNYRSQQRVNNMEAASPQGYQDNYPVKVPTNQPQTLQSPHKYPQFVDVMDPWQNYRSQQRVNNMEAASPQGYQDNYPVKVPANQPHIQQSSHQYPQFVDVMDPLQNYRSQQRVNNMEAASPQGYQYPYPGIVPTYQPPTLQSPHQYPQFVDSMDPWQNYRSQQIYIGWNEPVLIDDVDKSKTAVEYTITRQPSCIVVCCCGDALGTAESCIRLLIIFVNPDIYVYQIGDKQNNFVKEGELEKLLKSKDIAKVFHNIGEVSPSLIREYDILLDGTPIWDIALMYEKIRPQLSDKTNEELKEVDVTSKLFKSWSIENVGLGEKLCAGVGDTEVQQTLIERGKLMLLVYNACTEHPNDYLMKRLKTETYEAAIPLGLEFLTEKIQELRLAKKKEKKKGGNI